MGVDVAEDADPLDSRRIEFTGGHLLHVEELPQPGPQRLLLGWVVCEARDQTVGREDGETRILQRDEGHQDEVGRTALAHLALVGEGGLVAVVTVGDQQLARRELVRDRSVDGRVVDSPDSMGRAIVVGDLAQRVAAERGREMPPGIAWMEGEDGGEVVRGSRGSAAGGPPWARAGCARAAGCPRRRERA